MFRKVLPDQSNSPVRQKYADEDAIRLFFVVCIFVRIETT